MKKQVLSGLFVSLLCFGIKAQNTYTSDLEIAKQTFSGLRMFDGGKKTQAQDTKGKEVLKKDSAVFALRSIRNHGDELLINDSIALKRGREIQINLPSSTDFIYVKRKRSGLSMKLLSGISDVVGAGAMAVGVNAGSVGTISKAYQVAQTASTVHYAANAIHSIQDLPISNDAKKIVGQKMEILDWEDRDEGFFITALYEKKKYEISLQYAIVMGEVKLHE